MKFTVREIVPIKADWEERVLTFDEGRSYYTWEEKDDERVKGWTEHGIVQGKDRRSAQIALLSGQAVPGFLKRKGKEKVQGDEDMMTMMKAFMGNNVNTGMDIGTQLSGQEQDHMPNFDEMGKTPGVGNRNMFDRDDAKFRDDIQKLFVDLIEAVDRFKKRIAEWRTNNSGKND